MLQNSIKAFTLLLVLLFHSLQNVQAAIPQSINYQGYLTDPSGVALDGSFSIKFSLYNVNAGGIALWTNTKTVNVSKGLFSIELGGGTFPPNLFDNPLWLGINVAADGEMSPRTALTSAGFAFKADDANTVGGISPATLDQSAHVSDTGNPHNVTASQLGLNTGSRQIYSYNQYCAPDEGVTFNATCETISCAYTRTSYGCGFGICYNYTYYYYTCSGSCPTTNLAPVSCSNQFEGYLVK
ncbi:MAG: hypothetical protein BMS9Abin26_0090 [Gammaproteobacteria bacterium]|nr:MAG: hypothetical protein BMS9Abin26_0090 [Gammaproteobacteria bacterium]